MTSQLQQLAAAVRGLADEAGQPMQVLAHAQQRARQLALQAAALDDAGGAVAGRLFELRENLVAVSESMSTLRGDAHRFAAFLAHGGAGGRGSVASIAEAAISGWQPADPALGYAIPPNTESGRYRDAGEAARDNLARAIEESGAHHPCGWIKEVNPHFNTTNSPTFRQNCGASARATADAFQGRSTLPALGDLGRFFDEPGESSEMWETLGIPEPQAFTNAPVASDATVDAMKADATAFTDLTYARISAELAKLPPGSAAIIGVDWDLAVDGAGFGVNPRGNGGHWFNAGVDEYGNLWWADGQEGKMQPWPPPYADNIWNAQLAVREPGSTSDWRGVDL